MQRLIENCGHRPDPYHAKLFYGLVGLCRAADGADLLISKRNQVSSDQSVKAG
jgi:hypothetical protein